METLTYCWQLDHNSIEINAPADRTNVISYSEPFIWNSLPGDVLNCNSEHTFKKHLKTFLFNSCFYAAWLTPPLAPL